MKNLSLILFLTFNVGILYSQAFAPTGASWHYSYTEMGDTGFYQINSIGDTLIMGKTCQIIDVPESGKFSGKAYLNSTTDSVYMYNEFTSSFNLLYAFNAQVGDSWSILRGDNSNPNYVDTIMVSVDSIYSQTINLNVLRSLDVSYQVHPSHLNPSNNWSDQSTIVERIGDFGYLFNFPVFPTPIDGNPYPKGLRCYEDNSFGFYETGIVDSCNHYGTYVGVAEVMAGEIKVWPNPVNNIINIEVDFYNNFEFELYDLQGHLILSRLVEPPVNTINVDHLAPGLYTYKLGSSTGKLVIQ